MIRMQRKPALAVSLVLTSAVTVLVGVLGAGAGFFGFDEGHAQPEAATQLQPDWPVAQPAMQYVTDYEYYDDRAHNGAQGQPQQQDAPSGSVEASAPESDVPLAGAPSDDTGGTTEIHSDDVYEHHDENQPEATDVPEPQGTPEPHDPPEPTDTAH